MLPEAAALGAIDAADYFGLEKQAWARIIGTGVGALAGSALADRDDRGMGAIMGGLAGLGLTHGGIGAARWLGNKGSAAFSGAGKAVSGAANAGSNAAHSIFGSAKALAGKAVDAGKSVAGKVITPLRNATQMFRGEMDPKLTAGLNKGTNLNATYGVKGRTGRMVHVGRNGKAPAYVPMPAAKGPQSMWGQVRSDLNTAKVRADVALTNAWGGVKNWVGSKFSEDQTKEADVGFGLRVPKTPVNMSLYDGGADERLPGMHRWVPRDTIERMHAGLDQGLDPADVIHNEENVGRVSQPLIGAGVGAALTHFGMGRNANLPATALGGLFGAGAGAAYNMFNAPYRQQDAQEALYGVMNERTRERGGFPMGSQAQTTAAASTPMLVSSGANSV